MDHIRARDLNHNIAACWHNHRRVGGEQIFIARVAVFGQFIFGQHEAVKNNVMLRVLVAPIPLIACCLDHHFAIRNGLLLEQHRQ